jgi:xanthine dehydrogenase accessory factor
MISTDMSHVDDLLAEAGRLGAEGVAAALATLVRTAGSTPRHVGARMIVRADGTIAGTVGGGGIEMEVIAAGTAVARGGEARRVEKRLDRDLAMSCGGKMEVWVEPLDGTRWKAMAEAARRREARLPCALVTALAAPGGKDLLADDPCLRTRRPRLETERFVEPVLPVDRLVIFGSGHVAQALAPLAAAVGFRVVVCDQDERLVSEERFPRAALRLGSFDVAAVARELQPFGVGDHAIIVTRDHGLDETILEQLLPRAELAFLGLIGSRAKVARFRKRLGARGVGDEAAWARLRSPVGVDIGAETPQEIAVAVVAELIRSRRVGAGDGAVAGPPRRDKPEA